jgi:transposase
VYPPKDPGLKIRVKGQAPLQATVYELERLRCNLCSEVFQAEVPPGVGEKKYDESAAAMIGLLRYGSGVPFYLLAGLEEHLGIPLPASTQWDIVEEVAVVIRPAFDELIRQAAQGEVFCNDDTSMKILGMARASPHPAEAPEGSSNVRERTGLFTSGIVSTQAAQRIALYFTGRRHAGENLARVLAHRGGRPVCPRPSRSAMRCRATCPSCRKSSKPFWEIATLMPPEECRYVLESFAEVYGYDAQAEKRRLSPEERLRFHQEHSKPVMDQLHAWLRTQFEGKRAEPNSGVGTAITYVLRHWID